MGGSKTIQVSDLRKLGTTLSKAVAIFLDEGVARVTDVHDCLDVLAKGAPWKVHLAAMHTMFTSITCAKMCKGKSKDRALHFRATVLERKSKDESSAWGSSPAVREMIQVSDANVLDRQKYPLSNKLHTPMISPVLLTLGAKNPRQAPPSLVDIH